MRANEHITIQKTRDVGAGQKIAYAFEFYKIIGQLGGRETHRRHPDLAARAGAMGGRAYANSPKHKP